MVVALAVHDFLFERGLADERFLAAHTVGSERLRERSAEWPIARAAAVAGIEASALGELADLYAASTPAIIRCGWGLERNRNGGNAALAVLALPAVAGKFGVRGGGYTMSNSGAWDFRPSDFVRAKEPPTRLVNMNHLGRALLEFDAPPVKMLFVYNCNPAVTMPDQNRVLRGLERDDLFTVVFDQVRTDTTAYADVVLPATTFLEHYDIARSYGPPSMQLGRPVIDAFGEARPNSEVFGALARRLGLSGVPDSQEETLLARLGAMPERVRNDLVERGGAVAECGYTPVQFVDVFPRTADRKVNLFPDHLEATGRARLYVYEGDPASEAYPLALISPASDKTISSTLGELGTRAAALTIHPEDAAARGIEGDDGVRVFNDLGELHCAVKVSAEVRRGVVSLPKGLWRKSTFNGLTSNALVPDSLTDFGGGACFSDARVEVQKLARADWAGREVRVWIAETSH